MKRSDSLKRKKEFRYTYRAGRSLPGHLAVLVYTKNRQQKTRVGFSVSKKIGGAVQRNRVKRRLREALTPLLPRVKSGFNIIFVARQPIVDAAFSEIGAGLEAQLLKAGLITEAQN